MTEANLMPKPYYKPPNLWNFCRFGGFFVFLTVIFFYAVNKCVIINDTCHFCEEVEIFMCR